MKKINNKGRQGPGKHPARIPKKTTPPRTTRATSKKESPRHRTSISRPKPVSAHRMTTRSRAKHFKFMNMPSELRIKAFEQAFSSADEPLSLSDFKLPKVLHCSQTVRKEALPVFFAASIFTATFRSNWCVRHHHWHSGEYMRHHEAGILDLSPLLGNGTLALPEEAVRFRNVDFSIRCVCCVQVLEIGSVQLRVVGRKPVAAAKVTSENPETRKIWPRFINDVEEEVKKIADRPDFKGFTVGDLKTLAVCFRQDADDHGD